MIRVNKTWIRPNKNVKFFMDTDAGRSIVAYRASTYGSKISNEAYHLSDDGLTFTYTGVWASKADRDAMLADPVIQGYKSQAEAYSSANGIYVSDDQIVNL